MQSWPGSLACAVAGFFTTAAYISLFRALGYITSPKEATSTNRVLLVSSISALVESLPVQEWDNLTVSLAALTAGLCLFR